MNSPTATLFFLIGRLFVAILGAYVIAISVAGLLQHVGVVTPDGFSLIVRWMGSILAGVCVLCAIIVTCIEASPNEPTKNKEPEE